jgi:hypothetical protein
VKMSLSTVEVPVTFLKDREGRLSHHKREGWLSPFIAAWINLRAMFIYGSDFFLVKSGVVLTLLGLLLVLPLTFGDITLGSLHLSLNFQFLGVAVLAVGCQTLFFGCVAQVLFDYTGRHSIRWRRLFPYTRTVLIAFGLVIVGIASAIPLLVTYITKGLALNGSDAVVNHVAVTGLGAAITGAQLFVSTLLLHGTIIATTRGRPTVRKRG